MQVDVNDAEFRRFIAHLRERRIPAKYLYAGSAAALHARFAIEYSEEYVDGRVDHEIATLLAAQGAAGPPRQICDIGPSNGAHTLQFLRRYGEMGGQVTRYLGLDFSEPLLRVARRRLEYVLPAEHAFGQWDAELLPSERIESWRTDDVVLICFLGNTLGNVDDPVGVLRNLRSSVREGDRLLLGVYATPVAESAGDAMRTYTHPAVRQMIKEPLTWVGVTDELFDLSVVHEPGAIHARIRLRESIVVKGIRFEAGEEIHCFTSRRFDAGLVADLLRRSGWELERWTREGAIDHLVSLARAVGSGRA
ncbi:L-histidine N(alpha)-methyltransferase [Actinomadura rugatobispora]|uniref:L-histidine N(Alpha)-methyltransferase n=1 Tax=Actinomadura rugatobispora TaxID=1994 RepID=A0ABW1A985_9ACTN